MSDRKVINDGKIVVASPTQKIKQEARKAAVKPITPEATESQLPKEPVKPANNNPVLLFTVTQGMWKEPQKYIVQLAEHFVSEYNVHVVFGSFEFTGKNLLKENIEALGGTVHTVDALGHKNVLSNEISTMISLWKLMKEIKPQVVHFNDGKTAMLAGLMAMICGVRRTVSTIHGYPDVTGMKSAEVSVLNFFIKLSYGRAQRIIVRDDNTESWAKRMFGARKVTMILPGITEVKFTQPTEKIRAIAQDAPAETAGLLRDQQTIIIGNVAPLDADQGIAYTLQAIKILKEKGLKVVYIHYGDGDQSHLLEHEVNEFGLVDNVLFKGTDKMATSYFPIFDVVVHPTLRKGVPAIVRDLAQAERALIITDVAGVSNALVHDSEAMILPVRDAQALADAIESLGQNKAKRDEMGRAIRARVEKDYDQEHMFTQTKEVYS